MTEVQPPRGILVAAITPRMKDDLAVDVGAALELVEFWEAKEVDGITLWGSTGEFPHFDRVERRRLIEAVTKKTRLPLLANVSHSTLDGALQMACDAAYAGVRGVLLMPPYYYRYSQDTIKAFFQEFASRSPAPVYLYNIPFFTNELRVETSVELLSTGKFAGIKDSGGKWEEFVALQEVAHLRGLAVYMGADPMYSRARAAGAAGTISGVASALPELMAAIERQALAGQSTESPDALVGEFCDRLVKLPAPMAIREAMLIRGLPAGKQSIPLGEKGAQRMAEFREWFKEWLPGAEREWSC